MDAKTKESFFDQLTIQLRVIWALVMRETITMYGREGLGFLWIIAEPAMFVIGVMIIFSFMENPFDGVSVAEYMAVSYPTLLFWRNGTGKVTKAIDVNRALLHHQVIRPIDVIYSRIILAFTSAAASFFVLYPILIFVGIAHFAYNWFEFSMGYLLIIWFSFDFILIMSSLAEMSETFERTSHIILYLMLPFSGVFLPLFLVPEPYRSWLLYFPLVDAVSIFHAGYFGPSFPTYFHVKYTIFVLTGLLLIGYGMTEIAIKRIKITGH